VPLFDGPVCLLGAGAVAIIVKPSDYDHGANNGAKQKHHRDARAQVPRPTTAAAADSAVQPRRLGL
jgi:hypothetical protein